MELRSQQEKSYQTDSFTINTQTGEILAGENRVSLGPVNMAVLTCLITQPGLVISRKEIFDRVWPNQNINDDVLTRCISDLRSTLSKNSQQKQLIETLPRRGYRWLPEVTVLNNLDQQEHTQNLTQSDSQTYSSKNNHHAPKKWLLWISISALTLTIILNGFVYLLNGLIQSEQTLIAIVPFNMTKESQAHISHELSESLKSHILATKKYRYIAMNVIATRPSNAFPYFYNQFGVRWVIEGELRLHNGTTHITLNLVDARTAMVEYSLTDEIHSQTNEITQLTNLFITELSKL